VNPAAVHDKTKNQAFFVWTNLEMAITFFLSLLTAKLVDGSLRSWCVFFFMPTKEVR